MSRVMGTAVREAMMVSGVKIKHQGRMANVANYLLNSGWLAAREGLCGETKDPRRTTVGLSKEAFRDLQAVGIIPAGWIASIVWGWIVLPFLKEFLFNWFFGED